MQVVLEEEGGVGRVGEGGGQKRKGGERGWGRGEGTHQFVQSSVGTPVFFLQRIARDFLCIIVMIGARCNMSQHESLLTDDRALRCTCQRAT